MTTPHPEPEPGILRIQWERRVARNYDQYLAGDVPLRVLRNRYGKTDSELEEIAARYGVRAKGRKGKRRAA